MITYSTNWMGPVSTKWYEDNEIPYVLKKTSGKVLPVTEYKEYTESYYGGRIDIYGLSEEDHWGGRSEYGIGLMKGESWNKLSDFLDNYKTEDLVSPDVLLDAFEKETGHSIEWWKDNGCYIF